MLGDSHLREHSKGGFGATLPRLKKAEPENLKKSSLASRLKIQPPKSGSVSYKIFQPDCKRFAAKIMYKCFAVNNPDAENGPKGECDLEAVTSDNLKWTDRTNLQFPDDQEASLFLKN